MLVQSFTAIANPAIVATNLENVVTNDLSLNNQELAPCNHEESDTRLLLHVLSGSSCGYKKISIAFFSLDLEELWIEFGTRRNKRYFPIHQFAKCYLKMFAEHSRSASLLLDATPYPCLLEREKTAWNAWESFPEVTKAFVW